MRFIFRSIVKDILFSKKCSIIKIQVYLYIYILHNLYNLTEITMNKRNFTSRTLHFPPSQEQQDRFRQGDLISCDSLLTELK